METAIYNYLDQELGNLKGAQYFPDSSPGQTYWRWNDNKGLCHYISNPHGIIWSLSFRHDEIMKYIPLSHPFLSILIKEYFEIQCTKQNV